jgi:hypothetical protein
MCFCRGKAAAKTIVIYSPGDPVSGRRAAAPDGAAVLLYILKNLS